MVNFNRPQVEFKTPELSGESQEAMDALFKTTCDNTFTVAEAISEKEYKEDRANALMLSASTVFNSAIRIAFSAMVADSGSTRKLSQETIDDCIKMVVRKLSEEL